MDRENIIPTENDMIFRKQLLQGYVHDPGTAMLGGVCGHAGVFSNANDLAKIMQMYLNGGIYGRKRFFTDSTLKMFTDSPFDEVNGNRRAIGFDKPVIEKDKPGPTYRGVSYDSFGHTGFTGTIAWADREKDLIYIFLSNRIHPDQDNRKLIKTDVRTEIQKAIYEAILENPDR
jgi:CubicO group peptidase (beta-lactamase class C family)